MSALSAVSNEQAKLKKLGYYTGRVDGQVGPLTVAALEAQRRDAHGFTVPWMPIARAELGVSEIVGSRHNPRIIEYHAATDGAFETDEIPWCSSFANWCVQHAGLRGTRSALARSWLRYGIPCGRPPRYGDILIFERGAPPSGHVAFCVMFSDGLIWHLGGNQSNAVTVSTTAAGRLIENRTVSQKYV